MPVVLAVGAVVGVGLVVTADDDGPAMETVTTVDGATVRVPAGWRRDPTVPFTWRDPDGPDVDGWTVAVTCGGPCRSRPLADWLAVSGELPTFASARRDVDEGLLVDVDEEVAGNHRVLRAQTSSGATVVAVAVFTDGAERYVECDLFVTGDPGGLDDAIVEACLDADLPG